MSPGADGTPGVEGTVCWRGAVAGVDAVGAEVGATVGGEVAGADEERAVVEVAEQAERETKTMQHTPREMTRGIGPTGRAG